VSGPGCLVCHQHAAPPPGGLLGDDPLTVTYHRPPPPGADVYAGHLRVTSRRHAADLAALDPDEAAAVGRSASRWARALRAAGAVRVYSATVGHGADHLHVHLLPRWPGTPDDVPWHAVDDDPGGCRLDAAGVADLVGRLRASERGEG